MTSKNTETQAALSLLNAGAVRTRTRTLFELALQKKLLHFDLALERMPELADYVANVVRQNYPSLAVPFHARWRHFVIDGDDRWLALQRRSNWRSPADQARAAFDLAIVSVLLDAGAGAHWSYRDEKTGRSIGRSEGLALASLDMFSGGAFSLDPADPLRADAEKLMRLTGDDLRRGFQVSSDNPLEGVEGRVQLLNALGQTALQNRDIFARMDSPRPGGLFDVLQADAADGRLPAPAILQRVLMHLGAIWPSRMTLGGLSLGDTWRHPLLTTNDATDGLVPFHKLSQWLSYSLIEPLIAAGVIVDGLDGMTGLAEYRNGGLFVDGGIIVPKDAAIMARAHTPDSTVIVEWRALTVALLDDLLPHVCAALGQRPADFPLARMLEGGTWAAGRMLARERRADASPPLQIISDGTVF